MENSIATVFQNVPLLEMIPLASRRRFARRVGTKLNFGIICVDLHSVPIHVHRDGLHSQYFNCQSTHSAFQSVTTIIYISKGLSTKIKSRCISHRLARNHGYLTSQHPPSTASGYPFRLTHKNLHGSDSGRVPLHHRFTKHLTRSENANLYTCLTCDTRLGKNSD